MYQCSLRGVTPGNDFVSAVEKLASGAVSHETRQRDRAYEGMFVHEDSVVLLAALKDRHRSAAEAEVDQITMHSSRHDQGEKVVKAIYDQHRDEWRRVLGPLDPWVIDEETGTTYYWDWPATGVSASIRYEEVDDRPYSVDLSLSAV